MRGLRKDLQIGTAGCASRIGRAMVWAGGETRDRGAGYCGALRACFKLISGTGQMDAYPEEAKDEDYQVKSHILVVMFVSE